jgi:hypothetical protein
LHGAKIGDGKLGEGRSEKIEDRRKKIEGRREKEEERRLVVCCLQFSVGLFSAMSPARDVAGIACCSYFFIILSPIPPHGIAG